MAIIELGTDTRETLPEPETDRLVDPAATGADHAPAATGRERRAALTDPLSEPWPLVLTVGWVSIFSIGVALEPSPAVNRWYRATRASRCSSVSRGSARMQAAFRPRQSHA